MNRYIYIQKVQLYEETCNSIEIYNKFLEQLHVAYNSKTMFKCGFAFVSKLISMHEKIHEKNLDNKPSGILN